ncbi:MAG: hypothetical protein LCH60_04135 [Actinobacteria bacterium]|nr:hypothetical protein [Actinomycetota bacterium]
MEDQMSAQEVLAKCGSPQTMRTTASPIPRTA